MCETLLAELHREGALVGPAAAAAAEGPGLAAFEVGVARGARGRAWETGFVSGIYDSRAGGIFQATKLPSVQFSQNTPLKIKYVLNNNENETRP